MPALRGLTISVGYGPLLAVTLPLNLRHLVEAVVVTSPEDAETQAVVNATPGARLHVTDAHRRHGARFNKGLCMEEGFDVLGRHGMVLIWDADILLPDSIPFDHLRPNALHGARRRILADPGKWRPDLDWNTCPTHKDGGPIGFFQLFDASDPCLPPVTAEPKRPWYDVSFAHGGGADAFFLEHWPPNKRLTLPLEVLHLGLPDQNWFGTSPEARAIMGHFVTRNGWRRASRLFTPEQIAQAGEYVERVTVPGYAPSNYELPFVRRAQGLRAQNGGAASGA